MIIDWNPPNDIQTRDWNPPINFRKYEVENENRSGKDGSKNTLIGIN